jgi:hypothetical protein
MAAARDCDTPDHLPDLRDRFDRLVIRQMMGQSLATTFGFVLRRVDATLRREILEEMRKSIVVRASGFSDPARAERMALEMDEQAAQLLDQIERLARSQRRTIANHSCLGQARQRLYK